MPTIAELTAENETLKAEAEASSNLARQLQAELGAIKKVANPKRILALELFTRLAKERGPMSDSAVDTMAIHAYGSAERVLAQWDKMDAQQRQAATAPKPTRNSPHQ